MKLILESTSAIVEINGVPARVWKGETAEGIPVSVFITRLAVMSTADLAKFEAELKSCPEPRPASDAWPLRMIL